jgi:hypothetical protein
MSKKPTLIAYTVKERGEGQKAIWTRIGAAWPHGSGTGFTVQLDACRWTAASFSPSRRPRTGVLREHPFARCGAASCGNTEREPRDQA